MAARKFEIVHMAHIMLLLDSAGLEGGGAITPEEGPAVTSGEQGEGQAQAQRRRGIQELDSLCFNQAPTCDVRGGER